MVMGELNEMDFMGAEYPADFVGPLQPGDTRPATSSGGVTPQDVKDWTSAFTGAATVGAQAYRTVVDTVTGKTTQVPVNTQPRKDNTLLYIGVGLLALVALGGGTYMLVGKKRKGR